MSRFEFSPVIKTDKQIKMGIALGVLALAGLGGFSCYRTEEKAIKNSRFLLNSIRLGKKIENQTISIAGVLENKGGHYGDTSSECHFDFYLDKPRDGYTAVAPIRVILSFDGYNDMAKKRGERFNAIVTGEIREDQSLSFKPSHLIIGQNAEGYKQDVEVKKMWILKP